MLNDVIHENQTGFIASRFMGDNIRQIYNIIFETKERQIPGFLLLVDFEKTFDTVSWDFIKRMLEYFNFGPSFRKWIKLFYNSPESCIIQNGYMSNYFKLQRGCRQGDPTSSYLFILCAEVLGNLIRVDPDIKGTCISLNNNVYKLCQYADDTQIFLDGTESSLKRTLNILNVFHKN